MDKSLKQIKIFIAFIPLLFFLTNTPAQSLQWDWVKASYGGLSPYIGGFFVDQDSSIYTSFSFHDNWHVDSLSLYHHMQDPTDADLAVWKLNKEGRTEWLKSYGTNWMEQAGSIGRDKNNRLYVDCKVDKFISTLPIDTLSEGDYRFYLDENGQWLEAQKKSKETVVHQDAKRRVLKIGTLGVGDTLIFGRDTLIGPPLGSIPIYPEKYIALVDSLSGNYWAKYIGSYFSQLPLHFRFLDENKLLLVGVTTEDSTMACSNSTLKEGIFWAMYDSTGNCQRFNSLEAVQPTVNRLVINDQKETFLLGHYTTTLSFGGTNWNGSSGYGSNFCIIKLDQNGEIKWVNASEGGKHQITANSFLEDRNGNIIVGGHILGQADIEHEKIGRDSIQDIFICAFNPSNGQLLWTKKSDTQASQVNATPFYLWGNLIDLAISPENYLYVLGNFRTSSYTLGNHLLTFQGTQSLYVAALNLNITKSIDAELKENCPVHVNYRSERILIADNCPEKPIVKFNLHSITGQKIVISVQEKYTQGYFLQPAQSLPPGIYILQWERRNGERGVKKFVVRGD